VARRLVTLMALLCWVSFSRYVMWHSLYKMSLRVNHRHIVTYIFKSCLGSYYILFWICGEKCNLEHTGLFFHKFTYRRRDVLDTELLIWVETY
jgi:hypothetical protein